MLALIACHDPCSWACVEGGADRSALYAACFNKLTTQPPRHTGARGSRTSGLCGQVDALWLYTCAMRTLALAAMIEAN